MGIEGESFMVGGMMAKNRMYNEAREAAGPAIGSNNTFTGCQISTGVPKQVCFSCLRLFEPYMVDDAVWEKQPEELWDKYVCSECLRERILEGGDDDEENDEEEDDEERI